MRTQHTDFYVYALFHEDGETPFYIGKGRQHRFKVHEREAARGKSRKDMIIQSIHASGAKPVGVKLVENLTDGDAKAIEIDLIHLIGRYPIGPLANLTKGGDGVHFVSDANRAKKIADNIRTWADPQIREKRITSLKSVWTEERRIEHGKAISQRWANQPRAPRIKIVKIPERSRSQIAKDIWANEESRTRMIEAKKKFFSKNPITHERAMALSARLNSTESITRRTATNRLPEVREKRVSAQKAAFSTEEARAKRSLVSKKMWALKKAQNTLPSATESPSQPETRPSSPPNPNLP